MGYDRQTNRALELIMKYLSLFSGVELQLLHGSHWGSRASVWLKTHLFHVPYWHTNFPTYQI